MLAILAAVAFVCGLFDGTLGDVNGEDWLYLGLALLALHLAYPIAVPGIRRRTPPQ